MLSKVMLALLISSGLAACGGGGGGGGGAAPPQGPVGGTQFATAGIFDVNFGQFRGTYTFLDNGEFYGLHFVNNELAGHPRGLLTAANTVTAGEPIAWANFIDDAMKVGQQEAAGRFGRTFGATDLKVSIAGSMGTFTASTSTQKRYGDGSGMTLYASPIALTALAGAYSGVVRTAGIEMVMVAVTSFSIDASGNITASALGCVFTGKMVQHGASGVFDLQLGAAGAACKLNPALKGVVTPLSFANGKAELAVQVNSQDKLHSAVFIMTRN